MHHRRLLCLGAFTSAVCAASPGATQTRPVEDPHSFSEPAVLKVRHLDIDLAVDFDAKKLYGDVELTIEPPSSTTRTTTRTLTLDTRDLHIQKVDVQSGEIWRPAPFGLGEAHPILGRALRIPVEPSTEKVRIRYETQPTATGLQWLEAKQTAGKEHPFLYTQAQPISARSFLPLQDSPQVRVTYNATIRTPTTVRAVMSAENDPEAPRTGIYTFSMAEPIPSYLIALAVGDIHFQPMSKRTGIYAERAYLADAAAEFADTEKMLEVTEATFGPYRWGRYDILILPPSFPFGGMENPKLSFITPTVIAGDKSLVALIAHELAHSWSGNTVTNATWNDLWLNEGFTTYLTYRIMELVYGSDRWAMERVLGQQSLMNNRDQLPASDRALVQQLNGRDPDDAFTEVPYEQGALFLFDLEKRLGRESFDTFLKEYFQHFAFKSLSTEDFIRYLKATVAVAHPGKLDFERIQQWLYSGHLPDALPLESSNALSDVDSFREQLLKDTNPSNTLLATTDSWTVHEWLHFLNNMPADLLPKHMKLLDSAFSLSSAKNNEIAHSWLKLAIRHQFLPAFPRLKTYLQTIGRRKLIKPLYEELMRYPSGQKVAREIYTKARIGYHFLTQRTIDGILYPSTQP